MARLAGLVSAGIGLAAELSAAKKEKAKSRSQSLEPQQRSNGSSRNISQTGLPPPYTGQQDVKDSREWHYEDDEKSYEPDIENDEEDWDLDDAQGEVASPQEAIVTGKDSEMTVDRIVQDFVHAHPVPMRSTGRSLPFPVIIPQRRPENKERGFIRAYAPDLLDCGIDQDTFLDFIKAMNKATKASPWFDVVTISAAVAGFAPSVIAMAVTTAVQVGVKVAKTAVVKRQTNRFLEKMNVNLFKPHGLFCLIMTFKPGQNNTQSNPMDISSSILKSATQGISKLGNFRTAAGKTMDEIELPEAAPLVFPALDRAAEAGGAEGFRGFKKTVGDYFDRRAQAKYIQQNPDSGLTVGANPQFASRFGDPGHAANSGGLISLATGGLIDRSQRGLGGRRERRGERRAARRGISQEEFADSSQPRRRRGGRGDGGRGLRGGIKRIMKQDVLYLMIVNMPTEAEMAAYRNGSSPLPSSSASAPHYVQQMPELGYFPSQEGPSQQGYGYVSQSYYPQQQNQTYQDPSYR